MELLMLYLQRSIVPEKLVGKETVIRFHFTDIDTFPDWWLVVQASEQDLCVNDPGKEVDIYFTATVRCMVNIWMGDSSYKKAIAEGALKIVGPVRLTRNISAWLKPSIFADPPVASEIPAGHS